jgi:hypothetical protein
MIKLSILCFKLSAFVFCLNKASYLKYYALVTAGGVFNAFDASKEIADLS